MDANADERDTRGLISTAINSSVAGFNANCTLHPPEKLPKLRIINIALLRISWKAVSLNVIAGATVIESPVCTPIGSKFSTVQIMTTLSALSLNNSNSYSFHPNTAFSTNTSCIGDAFNPFSNAASNSLASCTNPPPVPPKVKDGLITKGNPILCAISFPSKKLLAT